MIKLRVQFSKADNILRKQIQGEIILKSNACVLQDLMRNHAVYSTEPAYKCLKLDVV